MKLKTMALSTILAVYTTVSAFAGIGLTIDGTVIQSDIAPFIDNGRTFVPVRVISENLGANVSWDGTTRTVGIEKEGVSIQLTIDNTTASVNGQTSTLDSAPQIVNGSTFVPIRFIAEGFNSTVDWDGASQMVIINSAVEDVVTPSEPVVTQPEVIEPAVTEPTGTTSGYSGVIYITKTGTKYHYDGNCNNGTYYKATSVTWLSDGTTIEATADEVSGTKTLEPCDKCTPR